MDKDNVRITVRPAVTSDMDQLCKVRNNRELFKRYFEECDGEKAYFLVGQLNGIIVGFGLVYLDITKTGKRKSHLPKLSDLYVSERYRGYGVGTALVQAREALAKKHGQREIFVSIDPDESPGMIRLARKLGYAPMQSEPYWTTATYYDQDGKPYEKRYSRIDFRKEL